MAMDRFYYDDIMVKAHGDTWISVAYTNKAEEVEKCVGFIEKWLEREPEKIVGVDVEYTKDRGPTQKAAVIQLCMGRNCLVYQMSAADDPCPKKLAEFLANPNISFAGVDIGNDVTMLSRRHRLLKIENFVDIQNRWKPPKSTNEKDSLADYAAVLVDNYYEHLKSGFDRILGHMKWEEVLLPWNNLEYAVKDAYATYEVYNRIVTFEKGQENLSEFKRNKDLKKAIEKKNKKKAKKKRSGP